MRKGQLVHIVWHDAETSNEWTSEEDLDDHSTLLCETVGYLVRNATNRSPIFVVAASRSKDADGKFEYNAITKIPKAWVKEIEEL